MQGARSFDNCPTNDASGIRGWFHEERTTCNTIIRIEESMNSLLARAALVGDETTSVRSNGGFRCTDGVAQGPLAGCLTGEGVRWETAQLLASTTFKCNAADSVKPAVTGPGRAVLLAEFYRAGDGNEESFRAQMIVSETDLAPNIPGEQTLWIQGVGCGTANVHFND